MIIALTGQKGGVGKSTTAINLAVAALGRGKRVLLVDADPQATSRTWGDVASEGGHASPTVVAMGATMHKPGQLAKVAESYDLVIIDAPPRHGDVQRSALMVADVAILPCGPSAAEAWALAATLDQIAEVQTMREDLQAFVLITRKQGRTSLAKGARSVLETSGLPVLSSELSHRIAYQEAVAAGMGVTTYAPRDAACKEISSLLEEIERTCDHGEEAAQRFDSQSVVCAAE